MKLIIDLEQSVIDRIKNKNDYDVTAILNAVDRALAEQDIMGDFKDLVNEFIAEQLK